jgi:hypothetical protein
VELPVGLGDLEWFALTLQTVIKIGIHGLFYGEDMERIRYIKMVMLDLS